ncbi:alanine racemase [Synechococcales cyanobacterium C]|uniref:Alanine racemase n=1 Tax=Petrachloros mirabilis ULC683 TaxID=2781853 RepID=A0A8K2A8E0_9CYAN|nr:alanine racemase [Petrachloros mirabilis]NCJ07015.1 alanine racemase [Petrachloros mirabilis ULC683]
MSASLVPSSAESLPVVCGSPFPSCDRAWITIDPAALIHNFKQLETVLAPPTQILAVVKADAYGHGAVTVARTVVAQGAAALGVATLAEGIALRQANLTVPIVILGAIHNPEQIQALSQWQLQPTLCSPEQARCFSQHLTAPLPVHLKIDTGMSRLGPLWLQGSEFIKLVHSLPNLDIASVYSHLATADDPDPSFMVIQQQRFEQVIQHAHLAGISIPRLHLANSAGALSGQPFHYDWVRIGLALYGLYPSPQFHSILNLQPVMQVKARVTQLKAVPAGTGVSYGHTYVTPHPMTLAVVAIGYADGVPRRLSNQISVLIRGQRVPQVGIITMDQLMVDVSDLAQVKVGDEVTLLGQDRDQSISADDWAAQLGTISYEIVCNFKPRLPRIVLG